MVVRVAVGVPAESMRVWPLPINSSHTVLRRWFAYGVPLAARREHLSVPEFPGELPLGVRSGFW